MKIDRILWLWIGVCISSVTACSPAAAPVSLAETATPELAPTPTSQPTPVPAMLMVGGDIPCYAGPATDYQVAVTISIGQKADVLGMDEGGEFWIIKNPEDGPQCWIEVRYSTILGEADSIPTLIVESLPTKMIPTMQAPRDFTGTLTCVFFHSNLYTNNSAEHRVVVRLKWRDIKGEQGYRLFRNGVLVAEIGSNSTSFEDWFIWSPGLEPQHIYRLEAYDESGLSSSVELELEVTKNICKGGR
jgi:hypothetical protein